MADYPPFMNSYGAISKILDKIKEAKTPTRFTVDFLSTNLGFSGGSYRPFIPILKRTGFLSSDGAPTDLYKSFRDPSHSKSAMAAAIKKGYSVLFERNEFADKLSKDKLEGLLIQITGLEKGNGTLKAIAGSFEALKNYADFEATQPEVIKPTESTTTDEGVDTDQGEPHPFRMNLGYTINLNLPKTDDISVYNAIFKAIKENLLR
jgi:hypothetical protein